MKFIQLRILLIVILYLAFLFSPTHALLAQFSTEDYQKDAVGWGL